MMHRARGGLLGLVMIASLLGAYACGGDDASDTPPSGDAGASDATTTSDGGGGDDGGGGVDAPSSPDGAMACGPTACTGIAGACGAIIDGCGAKVACEPCRYSKDPIGVGVNANHVAIAASSGTAGPSWMLALEYNGIVQLATKGAGAAGWQLERVAPDLDGGTAFSSVLDIDVAAAPDGTPWVAFTHGAGSYQVTVAHRTGSGGAGSTGTWVRDSLGFATGGAVAVASDGTPFVAYIGSVTGLAGGAFGAVVARYVGGNWNTRTLLSTSNQIVDIDIAMHGIEPRVVWYDGAAQAVRHAFPDPNGAAGAFVVEDVATTVSSSGVSLDVAIATDASGRSHVAYFPYRAGPIYGVRDLAPASASAAAWKTETATGLTGFRGPVRIASNPLAGAGAMVVASYDNIGDGLKVGFRRQDWSTQNVFANCTSQAVMDLAVDSAGTTGIVNTCISGGGVELWTQTGIYPAGFGAACDSLGKGLCNTACACPLKSGSCCIGNGACTGPISYCPVSWGPRYCGNASIDPALVFACQKALPQSVCNPDGGIGATEPADCVVVRQ